MDGWSDLNREKKKEKDNVGMDVAQEPQCDFLYYFLCMLSGAAMQADLCGCRGKCYQMLSNDDMFSVFAKCKQS